ncbi:MAG: asparagine--tRNA ligase, partial [Planctomycetes bacterium]|nr:asparagine--tRNA ligase [Planctomycetota bacterium]
MTPFARIKDLGAHVGQTVTIRGWLYNKRLKGKLLFLILRDGTGICQGILVRPEVGDELFDSAARLGYESSIHVTGVVRKDDRAPGGFELALSAVTVIGASENYPIAIQEDTPNVDKLLDMRHLWLRSRVPHAVMRVRHEVEQAIRDFFYERDFVLLDTPIFTPAACEGTTTLFEVKYFDASAYLTQSGQLYNEAAAMAHGKVYCFGPTFRAEKSKTRRHLTEFWMVEPEMAYADLDDVMALCEEFIAFIVRRCLERARPHLQFLGRDLARLERVTTPFPRLSYDEACAAIIAKKPELERSPDPEAQRLARETLSAPGDDFGAPDETVLGMMYDRPVMVHLYPSAIK